MIARAFDSAYRLPQFRRWVNRTWYQYLARVDRDAHMLFMNYGYLAPQPGAAPLALAAADEPRRLSIQLYAHVAGAIDLAGKDVLEVGSGRGGGASFIARYLRPRAMLGVDYAPNAVAFCQAYHRDVPGLRFQQGDAEALPLPDGSFDAVVNVESSHCYGSMERFVSEVARVLRPGGHFLFTDHRPREQVALLWQQLSGPLEVVAAEPITAGVLAALDADNARKLALIGQQAPRLVQRQLTKFAAVQGSPLYENLRSGAVEYLRFVVRKADA